MSFIHSLSDKLSSGNSVKVAVLGRLSPTQAQDNELMDQEGLYGGPGSLHFQAESEVCGRRAAKPRGFADTEFYFCLGSTGYIF